MTARCFGSARASTGCARRSGRSTGCSIPPLGFDVEISEITEEIAALAVQGPTSCAVLKRAGFTGVERLKPFEIGHFSLGQAPLMVSRTGFTGDLGYELWMAPDAPWAIWDALMEAGRTRGIRPIGSQALNIARIEAGFLSPHVDFVSAEQTIRTGRDRSPLELGLAWLIDFDKGHFNGRRALLAERARGPRRRLVGLDIDGNKPAHNALLYCREGGKREVGSVTSATWSPTCKRNIALAMVDAPYFSSGLDHLGGYLLESRTRLGAANVPRAGGGTSVLRARSPPRHAAGRLLACLIREGRLFHAPESGLGGDFPGRRKSVPGVCGKNIPVFHAPQNPLPIPTPRDTSRAS